MVQQEDDRLCLAQVSKVRRGTTGYEDLKPKALVFVSLSMVKRTGPKSSNHRGRDRLSRDWKNSMEEASGFSVTPFTILA